MDKKCQNEVCSELRKEFERIAMQYELDTGMTLDSIAVSRKGDDIVVEVQEAWVPAVKMVSNGDY